MSSGTPVNYPPATNRGVTDAPTLKNFGLDWLTVSSKSPFFGYPTWMTQAGSDRQYGGYGYNRCVLYADGREEYKSTTRSDMGYMLNYSGSTLAWIESKRTGAKMEILRWHVERGDKVTRLDLSLDFALGFSVYSLMEADKDGRTKTRTKVRRPYIGNSGDSYYYGSKDSDKQLRIYDKASESNQSGVTLTRAELQLRDAPARSISRLLANAPHSRQAGLIAGLINRFVHVPGEPIFEAIASIADSAIDNAEVEIGRKETNTEAWLKTTVVKALIKVAKQRHSADIIEYVYKHAIEGYENAE